jgi:hypothetical protein
MDELRAPDEARAQERGWAVVAAAYAQREPVSRSRRRWAPVVVTAAVAAVAAVALTPPGRAVVRTVREAIGVANADRTLYSLPTRGRVLAGGWVVNADGSTRRLGDYDDWSWSPFGRYVVAAKTDEIVALTARGAVRWQVGRPDVGLPQWGGTRTDTRIAYFSGQRLRVVAGDGTGDRQVIPGFAARIAPAWRPGSSFTLAYVTTGDRIRAIDADDGSAVFSTQRFVGVRSLAWSSDGSRLLVVTRRAVVVLDAEGHIVATIGGGFVGASFLPGTHRIVTLTRHAVVLGGKTLFRTSGDLGQIVASPDARWLLVTWPEADQWLFVPVHGGRIRAAGNIARQLDGAFAVDGWTS